MKENGLVDTASELAHLAQVLSKESDIAFDTEFIRESTFYPMLEIIQVATLTESWVVDVRSISGLSGMRSMSFPLPPGQIAPMQPLLDVFNDPKITKFAHASQADQECLITSFGLLAKPIFDTSIAASLAGHGESVGLANLLRLILDVQIKKGHSRTDWRVRPIPKQLLEYAHADVSHLVELGQALRAELIDLGRLSWAHERFKELENPSFYETTPEEIAGRLIKAGRVEKQAYGLILELVRWREERVRVLNMPRRWLADDSVLLDLAVTKPADIEHLSAFRGLNKGEVKNYGNLLLSAISRGIASQEKRPGPARSDHQWSPAIPTSDEEQAIDLLKCFIKIESERHRISAKHLLTTQDCLPLLRSEAQSVEDWVKAGLLSPAAASLIGQDLLSFLKGERSLALTRNGKKASVAIKGVTPQDNTG